jgi:hypothetical protein
MAAASSPAPTHRTNSRTKTMGLRATMAGPVATDDDEDTASDSSDFCFALGSRMWGDTTAASEGRSTGPARMQCRDHDM